MRCRACGAEIVFLRSPRAGIDSRVPTDASTVNPGDEVFEPGRHVSHFRTCTDPNRFSKRGRK